MSTWFERQMGAAPPSQAPTPPTSYPSAPPTAPPRPPQQEDEKPTVSATLGNEAAYERTKQRQDSKPSFCPSCGGNHYLKKGSEAARCFECGYRATANGSFHPGDSAPPAE